MRILVVTNSRIGDVVLSSGLLHHLVETYPQARLTLVTSPLTAPLLATVPNLERLVVVAKRSHSLHWFEIWWQCCGHWWDLVIDLRGSALAWLLAARRRRVLKKQQQMHRVPGLAAVLDLADQPPAPRLWTTPVHEDQARALIATDGPVLAVAPTANWLGKQWPATNFSALIDQLTAPTGILPGAQVAVFAGAQERAVAEPVIATIPPDRCIDLVGRVDLLTAYACLKRCCFFVGNDSGVMHLAAAAGIPTLGLFGPSREEHYGPWGDNCAAVRGPLSYEQVLGSNDDDTRAGCLMGDLQVSHVVQAAHDLWQRVCEDTRHDT